MQILTSARAVLAGLMALALFAVACTGGSTTLTEESFGATRAASTPVPTVTSEVVPAAELEPTVTPVPGSSTVPADDAAVAAGPSWANDRTIGECFNNVAEADAEQLAGPPLDCDGEHEYEIYFIGRTTEGPEAPFPTDVGFIDGLFATACDPALVDFAGASFDRVPVGNAVWTPPAANWEAGDRAFACVAEAGLRSENIFKVGTAAGGTLVSDEGIVARSTVDGQRDFFFSFQGSTLYPMTDGQYELPNISPVVLASGLLFASPLQDVNLEGTVAYDYAFETRELTRLDTGREGWDVASPHLLFDVPAFLFAARETEDDDWDLYLSRSADDVVALTASEADDRWPTLTPDQTQIVYHSGGDIWIMNADGTDQRQLTNDPASDFESTVSPDGTQIAFASDRSGDDDIWLMNIDGTDQRNLTNHPADEAWPFFSADGQVIYFQTDRLGVSSNIMVMETTGMNQSYFSFEFMTNGAILPADVTERFAAELPTLAEVLENRVSGVVAGPDGAVAEVAHSSGRLTADLPVGWEFDELESEATVLLAAPSIAAYRSSWAADGVSITVIDAATEDDFLAIADQAVAGTDSSCVLVDDTPQETDTGLRNESVYDCGAASTAIVVAEYDRSLDAGVLFEGQWDRVPSDSGDQAFITSIAESLDWS